MTKLELKSTLGDIIIEDLVVCPIDDHATVGISGLDIVIPEIHQNELTISVSPVIGILNPYLL